MNYKLNMEDHFNYKLTIVNYKSNMNYKFTIMN